MKNVLLRSGFIGLFVLGMTFMAMAQMGGGSMGMGGGSQAGSQYGGPQAGSQNGGPQAGLQNGGSIVSATGIIHMGPNGQENRFQFVDEDGDGICDNLGKFSSPDEQGNHYGPGMGHHHGWMRIGERFFHPAMPHQGGYYPQLEEGQVMLTGSITEISDDTYFSLLNGSFVVDRSDADIQYIKWNQWGDPTEEADLETGQRVTLIGTFDTLDDGTSYIKASVIRVMDDIHFGMSDEEAGLTGTIDGLDLDNGIISINGVVIRVDDSTVLRLPNLTWDDVQVGQTASAHLTLVDTDEDGTPDSLYAEAVIVRVVNSDDEAEPVEPTAPEEPTDAGE